MWQELRYGQRERTRGRFAFTDEALVCSVRASVSQIKDIVYGCPALFKLT
jgi:hypothetical protein